MKDMASWNEGDWIAGIAAVALFAFLALGGFIATRRAEEVAGHPRGLFVLFYAEMWERFSYYGMRALLILYLTKFWLFADGKANLIYGAYTSLCYITPVLGGYLADRWWGQRKAVLFGAISLAFGHLFMAYEGLQGAADPLVKQADPALNVFWLALALIAVGTGFLKGNISVIVGRLYPMTDGRRDGAFTIFYMGVNAGAFFGTVLVGYLGETIGWSWGFGLAGIGMVLGLIIFIIGRPALKDKGEPAHPLSRLLELRLQATGLAAIGVVFFLVQAQQVIQSLLIVTGIGMLAYTLWEAFKLPKEPRERIFAMLFLVALNPLFWGLFEQAGGSLNLYTDRYVDRAGRAHQPVPVDQPDLHHGAGSAVRDAVAGAGEARNGTVCARQVRPRAGAGRAWLPYLCLGREDQRFGADTGVLRLCDLPDPHHGRALPLACGPCRDEPAGPAAHGQLRHGRMVLHDRGRPVRCRQDRRGDRRGGRHHVTRAGAGYLRHDRLGGDRGGGGSAAGFAGGQALDARRYAGGLNPVRSS